MVIRVNFQGPRDCIDFSLGLTSLQEAHSASYGKYEEGNEMFFNQFDGYGPIVWCIFVEYE